MKQKIEDFVSTLRKDLHHVRKQAMEALECPRRPERRFGAFETQTDQDAIDLHINLEPLLYWTLDKARDDLKGIGRNERYGFVVPCLDYGDCDDVEDVFHKVITFLDDFIEFDLLDRDDDGWGWTLEDEWRIVEENEK